MEPFSMLQLLLSENQFELIFPETDNATPSTIRLVYLMNDAVESFLLFHNARLTGTYDPAYEGELDALLTQDENRTLRPDRPSGRLGCHTLFRRSDSRKSLL